MDDEGILRNLLGAEGGLRRLAQVRDARNREAERLGQVLGRSRGNQRPLEACLSGLAQTQLELGNPSDLP